LAFLLPLPGRADKHAFVRDERIHERGWSEDCI
jgi:hypothetical protein